MESAMASNSLEINCSAAAGITSGRVDDRFGDAPLGAISTDSRTIAPGETFLALRGERHDGHRHLAAAVARGAAGLIVAADAKLPPLPRELPILRVADTLAAYGDLAAARRRAWGGPVLAIGGSAGKTTTRRLVTAALATRFRVLEPIKNYNNLVGVPQTLLQLQPDHQVAVLELGMNQPGELRRLAEIAAPSVALLTRIDRAHVGMFDSMKALAEAKLDLFRGCAPGTPLVVNAGCGRTIKHLAPFRDSHPIVSFRVGRPSHGDLVGDVRAGRVTPVAPVGYRFELLIRGEIIGPLELHLFGRHHLENVAAAAAMLLAAGHDPALLADALPTFRTEPLRGQVATRDGIAWILDCYNASPPAMLSSLESLLEIPYDRRRVLVLADMLELGKETRPAHEALVKPIVRLGRLGNVDFLGLGRHCAALARDLATELESLSGSSRGFETIETLIDTLRGELRPGDQVFLKGSHGFALEKVAEALAPGITGAE
jgi:UDP-N-acetylmuramoyl-tripeptide--D-alanyl-D-alanine ligase